MLSRLILLYLIIYQYVIHEFSSAVLLPALPDFRTKSVCPVVDVSLAGTTLDAAFRATGQLMDLAPSNLTAYGSGYE